MSMKLKTKKKSTQFLKIITGKIMLPNSVLNNAKYHNRASMISKERKVGTKRILVSAWPEFTTWEINFNSTKEVMTAISLPGGKSSNYNHPHPQVIFSVCSFCSVWKIAMVGSVVLGNFFPISIFESS